MAICESIVSLPFGRYLLLLLQSTIALRVILACAVSSSNAAHASQSPQSNTRPGQSQSGTSANCHQACPAAAVRYTSRVDYLTIDSLITIVSTLNCQRPLTPDTSVEAAQPVAG